jgi:hypothetical protein
MARMKKTARITVKTTPELKAELVSEARRQDRTESWLAGKYIEEGLQRDKTKRRTR